MSPFRRRVLACVAPLLLVLPAAAGEPRVEAAPEVTQSADERPELPMKEVPAALHPGPVRGVRDVPIRRATIDLRNLKRSRPSPEQQKEDEEYGEIDAPRPTPEGVAVKLTRKPVLSAPPASSARTPATSSTSIRTSTTTNSEPALTPTATTTFIGLYDQGNSIPPDTQGAVGPQHLMAVTNPQIRYQSRDGMILDTVSRVDYWNSLGVNGIFDPRVLYDVLAQRWILVAVSDRRSSGSSVNIAVSQSADPRGAWNLFRIKADPDSSYWADFPMLGYNKDWIVISFNAFTNANDTFVGGKVLVFEKSVLYANGTPSLRRFNSSLGSLAPAVTYDANLATMYLVSRLNAGNGQLRVSTVSGTVGDETFVEQATVLESPLGAWSHNPPVADFAPQLGETRNINVGDARVQNVVYRNGSLWLTHSVFLPAGGASRASVQWWQVLPDGTVQQCGRIDDPEGLKFYTYPSIAVNGNNDVLIGYSRMASDQYASANYAFRAAGDAPNTIRPDLAYKPGESPYYKVLGGTLNRWGDYSATAVDPVNDTDFWTIQEYAGSAGTWGTYWAKAVPPAPTPVVALSSNALAFGPQPVGTQSAAQTVTLSNNGDAPLQFTITTPAQFALTTTCVSPLAQGASCALNVKLAPTAVMAVISGTLGVTSNAAGSPHNIALSGSSYPNLPTAELTPPTLEFGNVLLGTSRTKQVTLKNVGAQTLQVGAVTVPAGFAQSSDCAAELAYLASCTITVTFTPGGAGARSGEVAVASNESGGRFQVPVSGSGFDFTVNTVRGRRPSRPGAQAAAEVAAVEITPLGSVEETLTLTCEAPRGLRCSVTPKRVELGSGKVTAEVSAAAVASRVGRALPAGEYSVRVRVSAAGGARSVVVPVSVGARGPGRLRR